MYYKKYGHVVIASTVWTYLSKTSVNTLLDLYMNRSLNLSS